MKLLIEEYQIYSLIINNEINSEKPTFILRTDKMRDKNVSNEYMYFTMEQRIEFLEKDRGKIRRENERLKKENQILRGELKRQKELLTFKSK